MSGHFYTCRPDPDHPDVYEIVAPDGSVIDRMKDFQKVEETLRKLNKTKGLQKI
jgi:hypothetical protein